MWTPSVVARALTVTAMAGLLAACGGSSGPPAAPPPSVGQATVGAAGGVIQGPDGVEVAIAEGVLSQDTTVRVARDSAGAPEVGGLRLLSPIYQLTPHGLQFDAPARVSIPFDPTALRSGTAPVIVRAQAGGSAWELLASDVVGGNVVAADSDGFSYYAVGECYISRDVTVPGPDPIASCPSSHSLQLTLRDGSGAMLPQPRSANGALLPAITIDQPTTIGVNVAWKRPTGTSRTDTLLVGTTGNLVPALRRNVSVTSDIHSLSILDVPIDPATVYGASAPGGKLLTIWASVSYGFDAWYPGCPCWRPTSWTYSAKLLVRVVYHGAQPVITRQPGNASVTPGQTASFEVAATGPGLTYQWRRSNDGGQTFVDIAGQTQSSTGLIAASTDDGAQFRARVCARSGSPAVPVCVDSNAATLTVLPVAVAPAFTQHPQSTTIVAGQTASLSAVAIGTPAPTVRWFQMRALPLQPFEVGTPCTGSGSQTACSFTTPALATAQSGIQYYAEASNGGGSVASNAATITVQDTATAPAIAGDQPADVAVSVGQTATFSVTASGTAPLSYQWARDGADIAGANATSLTVSNLQLSDSGARFSVAVSNGAGQVTSRGALLTVRERLVTAGACTGSSGTGWCWIKPTPHSNDLTSLVLDGTTLAAFGARGTRMRSGDDGQSWSTDFPDDAGFRDVQVPAAGVWVAVGDRAGVHGIHRSTDGGQSWTLVHDASTLAVNSLAFADANNGVAVGTAIWRTDDGGLNWSFVDWAPGGAFLPRVAALGSGTFVAISDGSGTLIRSIDGGATWSPVATGLTGGLMDLAFGSSTTGAVIDASNNFARTLDGGLTWSASPLPGGFVGTACALAFSSPSDLVLATCHGWILRSSDAGATWLAPDAGLNLSTPSDKRLRFINGGVGFMLGQYGLLARTLDGGATWAQTGGGRGSEERLAAMRFGPGGLGLAAGTRDLVWRSADGGATWASVTLPGSGLGVYRSIEDFAFAGSAAVAVGGFGRIYRSVDDGQSWSQVHAGGASLQFFGVDFATASVGVAVGFDSSGPQGVIHRTTDGGQTWSVVTLGAAAPRELLTVRFVSASVGYAAGGTSLLRTGDGGQSWAPVTVSSLQPGSSINQLALPSANTIVMASDDGIHRSADGGLTWARVASGTAMRMTAVSFSDANNGVAAGDRVLRSTDGGATWSDVGGGVPPSIQGVAHLGTGTVFLVGEGGAILVNTQGGVGP